ncbi:MAG: hypothetical protein JW863_08000 [Chitinispirillaceae bacterium]|nr:hypothetical protein [Chitinispirillaceae bacterium]
MRLQHNKVNLIVAVTCMVCFMGGCAKAPDAELAAAKQAIQAAKDAEADVFMSKNYANLEKAMEMVETEIARQKTKFVMMRKYKNVTEMLEKTLSLANELTAEAPKIKADMVKMLKENLGLVDGMLQATGKDIKRHSRGQSKAVIDELKGYLAEADSAAARAKANFDTGNVMGAKDEFGEVQAYINKITGILKPKEKE